MIMKMNILNRLMEHTSSVKNIEIGSSCSTYEQHYFSFPFQLFLVSSPTPQFLKILRSKIGGTILESVRYMYM